MFAVALVVHKKEGLVLDDGPPDIGAIEVEPNFRFDSTDSGCPTVCVHRVVAEELPGSAMKIIRAVLDRYINDCARAVAVLGRVAIALHSKLLYRIYGWKHDICAVSAVAGGMGVIVDSIEQIIVL